MATKKLVTFLLYSLIVISFNVYAKPPTVLTTITNTLKSSVSSLSPLELQHLMKSHYQTLNLMDNDGNWNAYELENISEQLLPPNMSVRDAFQLIDEIAHSVNANPYLVDVLQSADGKKFTHLLDKSMREGDSVYPSVIAYAMVQERLTKAMVNNWALIEVCKNIWVATREELGITDLMDAFGQVKLLSVEGPISDYIEFFNGREIPTDFLEFILPLNIMEAVAADVANDYYGNARTGVILGFHKPGEQPTRLSDNGKSILASMPLPKQWADLYAVWNLAFVSRFETFPYAMVKLLIPQVNSYSEEPEAYIFHRSLALYTHLHFSYLTKANNAAQGLEEIQWYDHTLTKFFGTINIRSAHHYRRAVTHGAITEQQ